MKKFHIFLGVIALIFITWQASIFFIEPQIIEILPVTTSKTTSIDPLYPEPVRVVFDRPIMTENMGFSVNPPAKLKPQIRLVQLRSKNNSTVYPAYVLSNTYGLQENTLYEVIINVKQNSIFDYLFPKRVKVFFRTKEIDSSLPKESGESLDKRLFGK